MKRTFLILAGFIALTCASFAQGNIHYYGWDSAYAHIPSDIIQTQDGGLLIIGDVNSSMPLFENYYFKRYLVRTDANGDTLWTKYYIQPSYGGPNVIESSSGDFIALGRISGGNVCGVGSFVPFPYYALQTYSSAGDSLSTAIYNDDCNNYFQDFTKTSSGGMAALLRASNFGNNTFSIKEISAGGTMTSIPISTNYMDQLEEASNGYWLSKYKVLYKVSQNGDSLWTDTSGTLPVALDFCRVGNDSLVFMGSTIANTVNVVKTDSIGNIDWEKQYAFDATDIMYHSSGKYVLTGTDSISVAVLLLDGNGDSIWNRTYQLDAAARGVKAIETNDGIAILAYSGGWGEPVSYALILETLGTPSSIEKNKMTKESTVHIYPNPTAGEFVIEINAQQRADFEIKVFNILGEEIFSEKVAEFKGICTKQLDLRAYPAGIYNLQLLSAKEVITRQVIIQ